jgi:L-alanine-DL-glutamate epimerase-like enolase superfamily enzyme
VALCRETTTPILMGENLGRRSSFKPFIVEHGCDIVQLDVRNTGGLLEAKKVADLADTFNLPMAAHNTGSVLCTAATAHFAAAARDFVAMETVWGGGTWMDRLVVREGPLYRNGWYEIADKPGLGVELDPDVARAHLAAGERYWT